jgi:ribosomal protein S18 acetylase RimI-like enzyme
MPAGRRTGSVVAPLKEEQIKRASEMLARAFQEDPLGVYMLPDPEERRRLSPHHFGAVVRYGFLAEKVWAAGDLDGVVVCQPPGRVEFDEGAVKESGLLDEAEVVGEEAFGRFTKVMDAMEPLRRRDAGPRHWYVMVLGVDPSKHGQGVGSALLAHVAALADRDRVPCYLETAGPQNVRFYQGNGYRVVVEGVEPTSRMRYWTLRREPAP